MQNKQAQKVVEIDAKGKVLGRLASEIAQILRGKDQPSFVPNRVPNVKVLVSNISEIVLTGSKALKKEYIKVSGYPGGLRRIKYQTLKEKNPALPLIEAVKGMLPKNKLQSKFLANINFK